MAKKNHIGKISEDLIVDRIKFENPWWETGKTDDYYNDMERRFKRSVNNKLIKIIITGKR